MQCHSMLSFEYNLIFTNQFIFFINLLLLVMHSNLKPKFVFWFIAMHLWQKLLLFCSYLLLKPSSMQTMFQFFWGLGVLCK
jgi:hypothetical protein